MSKMDDRLLLPQHLVAKVFGISAKSLANWDIQPYKRTGRETLYYLPEVIAWRLSRDSKEKLDLTAERARLAKAQAEKTEMENRRRRGELLIAGEVQSQLERVFVAIRARLLAIPSKVVPQLLAARTQAGMHAVLSKEVREILTELSSDKFADECDGEDSI